MTDRFVPLPLAALLKTILSNLNSGHYFGIPREVFYVPTDERLDTFRFGKLLGTPVGPAAGPHTQLSQNIVGAWLCGARYIELKTVQTLDELEVSKPCIDLQDEGYNCEWSQELRIPQSFEQYLDAWILIHLLAKHLEWKDAARKTIFNMSVGYNLEGILKPNVQWFFEKMNNCEAEIKAKIDALSQTWPWVKEVKIPSQISNNITLSTMHGCPPDEIEKIGMYLIQERKLHTVIKLNPTLLGPETVREILNHKLGYKTPVPDQAFEHDLKYTDALRIISNLEEAATAKGVFFGLKLTNTLESKNFRNIFAEDQQQMYMSGKALHPLAVNLAAKIREDFPHMDISFSAGADCFNIHELLACNLSPVTLSSDLLKPGGYGRLSQYISQLHEHLYHQELETIVDLMQQNPEEHLRAYSASVADLPVYKKALREPNIKTLRPLQYFDCIHAPCMTTCPGDQNIPLYMHYVSQGNWQKAFEVIMLTNPFPTITGTVCDHDCQSKCTRINYDSTLAIREIKRYVASFEHDENFIKPLPDNGLKAAIIGAGPAGLSCAWYLKLAGFEVDVYEEKPAAGGMVQQVIPDFRMTEAQIEQDIQRIISLGVNVHFNTRVDKTLFEQLKNSGAFIFVGIGATSTRKLGLPGEETERVEDPLQFLAAFKQDKNKKLEARNILILGGGNTAMDVSRTARQFANSGASVKIIYRRTVQDMPASVEEIMDARHEGVEMHELLAPVRILTENGHVKGLECIEMEIFGHDESGRQKVRPLEGTNQIIDADLIIPAVGQHTLWDFAPAELMKGEGFHTQIDKVYIGGDARAGASNIITAIGDGRRAAEAITNKAGKAFPSFLSETMDKAPAKEMLIKKAHRILSDITAPTADGHHQTINSHTAARTEAARCLLCDEICNICVTVCPNFANQGFEVTPQKFHLPVVVQDNKGNATLEEDMAFEISQQYQVYNIADMCNECGNCRTFCPTMGAPYQDKPKLHLSDQSWDAAKEGFRIVVNEHSRAIHYKTPEGLYLLSQANDSAYYTFQTPDLSADLKIHDLSIENYRFLHSKACKVKLEAAAIMHILLTSIKQNS